MFAKLLNITEGLHRYLQVESLDLGRVAQYKMATVQTLTDLRTDAGAEDVILKAMTICEENQIQLPVGPRQKQKRLDWFVVESACGSTSNPTTSDDFRHQLFLPLPGPDDTGAHPSVFRCWRGAYVRHSNL